ncbi:MAG: mucoidy inhibitor MuiA family protein [Polyangiales bacterium]
MHSLRRSSVFCSLALSLVPVSGWADTIRVESRVSAATVFPSAASVRRSASVQLAQGEHELVFGPLPTTITDESVRLNGVGPGLVTDAVTVRVGTLGERTALERQSLQESIDGLRAQLSALSARRERIEGLRDPQRTSDLRALTTQIIAVNQQIASRTQTLAQLTAQANTPVKYVTVDVQAARAGAAELSLEYAIPGGATWRPAYAAYLSRDGRTVALDVLASMQQSTGEDWSGVRVTVSSVNPTGAIALPTLGERAISLVALPEREEVDEVVLRRRVATMPGLASAGMARPSAASMGDMAVAAPPTRIEHRAAAVRQNLLSARLEVAMPVTLRSGAPARRILAAHSEIPCAVEHHAAPRESSAVFLTAKLRNSNAFPLLAGNVALFVDNEYVGTTALRDVPVEEEVVLPFGIDPSVSVDRTLASRDVHAEGGREQRGVRFEYRVSNHREQPVDLVVYEQIPVSRSQGLTVRTSSDSRSPSARREGDAPGVLRWNVRLTAGESDRWRLGVLVSAPRGREIDGELD